MTLFVYLASFFAISCYASLAPLAKKLLPKIPSFTFIAITMVFLATFSAVASFFYEKDFSISKLTLANWGGLAIFSCINFLGFFVYLYAISKIPITHYQLIGLMTPIVGGVVAYFLLGEPFKPQYLAGLVLIGSGLFVALRDWS